MSDWRPATEPPPDKGRGWSEPVLVFQDYLPWAGGTSCAVRRYYHSRNEWEGVAIDDAITHWMPLPAPPDGDAQ